MGCLNSTPSDNGATTKTTSAGGADANAKKVDPPVSNANVDKTADAPKADPAAKDNGGDGDEVPNPDGVAVDFKGDAKAAETSGGEESYSFWERNKTVKPVAQVPAKGGKGQKLHNTIKATMKATLGGGDLRKTVQLPEGEDLNEWIAVNTVHFYNAANMIYGTCAEFCTEASCKTMTAGRNEYLWKDGDKYKKATKVSAPVYIDLLLNWVNEQISNPKLFPVDEKASFPSNFRSAVRDIYKRLFRLYAHIYYSHFEKINAIGAKAHLNTCFKHFVFFVLEFKLIDDKDLAPLKNFIDKFKDQKEGS